MMTMTPADVEQIDPVLGDDGRSVFFYGHTPDDDQTYTWSIKLPMVIEESAFEDMLTEWRELAWIDLLRQT